MQFEQKTRDDVHPKTSDDKKAARLPRPPLLAAWSNRRAGRAQGGFKDASRASPRCEPISIERPMMRKTKRLRQGLITTEPVSMAKKSRPNCLGAGFGGSDQACALGSLLSAHWFLLVGTQSGLSIDVALQSLLALTQDVAWKLLIALASHRLISAHLS